MGDEILEEFMAHFEEEKRKEQPDYSITVYCDDHLGVKMRLAQAWTIAEWSDTGVDSNTNPIWICPKDDCVRSYEPRYWGYHSNDGKMGSRVQVDTPKQRRGNHSGLPFMYIGKVGEGRRYLCPLYKCNEQGEEVSAFVVDEEVEAPTEEAANQKRAERQHAEEMLVFQEFAIASGLNIDPGSAENREPRYPDIFCTISGEKYFFELGEIVSTNAAEKRSPQRRKHEGGFSCDQREPFVEIVEKKAKKNYETDGAPVDIILHFDLRFASAGNVKGLAESYEELLDTLIRTGPFKRVWIFDSYQKKVVWAKG